MSIIRAIPDIKFIVQDRAPIVEDAIKVWSSVSIIASIEELTPIYPGVVLEDADAGCIGEWTR